jgi:hypothetical protein
LECGSLAAAFSALCGGRAEFIPARPGARLFVFGGRSFSSDIQQPTKSLISSASRRNSRARPLPQRCHPERREGSAFSLIFSCSSLATRHSPLLYYDPNVRYHTNFRNRPVGPRFHRQSKWNHRVYNSPHVANANRSSGGSVFNGVRLHEWASTVP